VEVSEGDLGITVSRKDAYRLLREYDGSHFKNLSRAGHIGTDILLTGMTHTVVIIANSYHLEVGEMRRILLLTIMIFSLSA
jgi:hypothetical protein